MASFRRVQAAIENYADMKASYNTWLPLKL